ncbi:O-methyltransferase [Streptomyces broussonetiae]|uniref:Class I SAM-dependent methyltransferase n=1 Tax=Streptomyces broussonetiae TaxID=2686304 RepID=A0ABV5E397_9ACTN
MSTSGTDAYDHHAPNDLPPLVRRALTAARTHRFPYSCRPEQGRLLYALAGVTHGPIGETGTGYGVGLAWLVSGAPPGTPVISVERDPERAATTAGLFADRPEVRILTGDWRRTADHGPYDLLVLDGGGTGKTPGDTPADPASLLAPGGTVVIDDFSPSRDWPPTHEGAVDLPRLHWLTHPALHATEVGLAEDLTTVLGRLTPPAPLAHGVIC